MASNSRKITPSCMDGAGHSNPGGFGFPRPPAAGSRGTPWGVLKLSSHPRQIGELVRRAAGGEQAALVVLFSGYRSRLGRMIRLRLDRRLRGRVDPSDVLQDAFIDVAAKLPGYALRPAPPFSLWLRMVVGERLLRIHRHHLGAAMRDAGREISLHRGASPEAGSASLAARLLGRMTSPSWAALRAE